MKQEKAKEIVEAAIALSTDMGDIYRSINHESDELKDSVLSVIYNIYEDIIHPLLGEYPVLRAEIEGKMKLSTSL
jgi:CII-binding regulator of phage lambda lysogenization HflD